MLSKNCTLQISPECTKYHKFSFLNEMHEEPQVYNTKTLKVLNMSDVNNMILKR